MIKKIIIFVVVVFSLFLFFDSANAANVIMSNQYQVSTLGYFTNCTSNGCWNYVGEAYNTDESIPFWTHDQLSTTGWGPGLGISTYVSEGFVKGNYYTVTLYLSNSSMVTVTNSTSLKRTGLGTNKENAYNNNIESTRLDYGGIVLRNSATGLDYAAGVSALSYTFKANVTGNYFFGNFTTTSTVTTSWFYYGYSVTNHGSQAPTTAEISAALQGQFNSLENSINNNINELKEKQDETNQTLDEIKDMDISDEDKELPDDTEFNNYQDAEDDLMDKVSEADMSVLDVAIDADSSSFVWDTLTDLINSHTLIFGTVIAILSIGIIKLALGR